MGRATSGVTGMKFRPGDELLSMSIIRTGESEEDRYVFTVTDGGFAKRTAVAEYRQQGRGGLGIKAMKLAEDRGSIVGGVVVNEADEVIALKASGQITRSPASEVPVKGRDTMGVRFVGVRDGDSVVAIALYPEVTEEEVEAVEAELEAETGEPDVVSEAAESGVPVQVLEAEDSPAVHGGSESAAPEDESTDPVEDDSID
jgi:DNA gyrase subunit A